MIAIISRLYFCNQIRSTSFRGDIKVVDQVTYAVLGHFIDSDIAKEYTNAVFLEHVGRENAIIMRCLNMLTNISVNNMYNSKTFCSKNVIHLASFQTKRVDSFKII